MRVAPKAGKLVVRSAHGIVNTIATAAVMLILLFSAYTMWDSRQLHSVASHTHYARYNPTADEGVSFEQLQAINPDVFAWLSVYGTNIMYPMVQGRNNMQYVSTNVHGRFSLSGAIFLDHRACRSFTDFSSIVYGHHMASNAMFGEIAMFVDRDYFDARPYGMLFFDGKEHGLEFFAFVYTPVTNRDVFRTTPTTKEAKQAHLDMLLEIAVHTRAEVDVTIEDRIVLLSTCSPRSHTGRDILIGRITDNIFENPFLYEPEEIILNIPVIDEFLGVWQQIPQWLRITAGTLAVLLIVLLSIIVWKKKRK